MFEDKLREYAALTEACLATFLQDVQGSEVGEAMAWACQGGKRLRAFLVMESAALHDVALDQAVYAAAAVEALHAYSLVHDDLPCMDDDDLRRGLPTVHVKWDEATGVLAGDALQSLAFQMLTRPDVPAEARLALIESFSRAIGGQGMVLGQAQDIAAETAGTPLTLEQITILQRNKTGALIGWSAEAGARMAGADVTAMTRYAQPLGVAFQIADDILDVEGDTEKTGKRVGKDADAGKATFVSLMGLDGAKAHARQLVGAACDALGPYGTKADNLRQAARFAIARDT
ncbi:polyprenyl synthetase family protein [Aliiroseovarius sp. PTFE2010]|uniref:polyprenyl synthetase family protein n=1 Tax=Aliiroseovarius sp. PTFE2010 TaxID=3417190 RepID=UPI003CF2C57D